MNRRGFLAALTGGGLAAASGFSTHRPRLIDGARRGRGDPVSVTRTITDESITYDADRGTVRYPTLVGSDGPIEHESEPFVLWANRRCASVGSEVVLPAIADRVDGEPTGIGKGVSGTSFGLAITVSATTTRDRDGTVVSEPSVPLERLVAVTPASVSATIQFDGREHTRHVPVFVEESEVSYL
ncbi:MULTISPECIES: hypothetical protein [Halomicrobium]|uniref:Twin-arginine translocation signal domain-containing protein n=2 Tax=Halomicrobium mukohataei TaxID=57705 RepID=C7P2Q1_HALMD|nr:MULTISPECIES: hypothetical protein [Halomicrobium]ACV47373.1 hypothetical protein Hmuk_1251 [Halomicrobium mukohataei DSM 12286]QCD65840.1 hypothetical protein E5139_09430 [Halomicrobium mukohataei]QFR20645.1 hypothetical protein GBQ70_09425 [Halomicrobium sp. ZPS1]